MTLAEANALDAEAFVARFGAIAEHAPWVAAEAARSRPFADRGGMVEAFQRAILAAPRAQQEALLHAHPDLAGRLAIAALQPYSQREQAGAGLDQLTADEHARFLSLNARYRERFGHPFILAVKGVTKDQILESFESRLNAGRSEEFLMALAQVCRIVRFRLEAAVAA